MAYLSANFINNIVQTDFLLFCVCLVFTRHVSSTDSGVFMNHISSRQTSYFDVLNDVSNTMKFAGDETRMHSLKNISGNLYKLFHSINDFALNADPENLSFALEKLASLPRLKQHEMKSYFQELQQQRQATNNIPPDVLATLDEVNDDQRSTCMNDTGRIITGLFKKEPWAVQFFDAAGKPGPSITQFRLTFVGNYDQCRAAIAATPTPEDNNNNNNIKNRKDGGRFKGKYGSAVIKLWNLPLEAKLGVCIPDTCSDLEITVLLNQLFGLQKEIPLQYAYFADQTLKTEMTAAAKTSISILSIIGFFIIVGTLYDLLVVQRQKWVESGQNKSALVTNMNSVDLSNGNGHVVNLGHAAVDTTAGVDKTMIGATANGVGEKTPLLSSSHTVSPSISGGTTREGHQTIINPQSGSSGNQHSTSTLAQVFLSFSVYSNGKKVLNTAQAPGSLGSIHGIRFLSMSWVVLCHMFAFSSNFAIDLVTAYPELLKRWTFLPISNGFVCVDTFFTLSGLLTSYLTIKEMMRRNTWKINWPLFYFHRFWRLTPPYMFSLVIVLGLSQFMGQGALWGQQQPYDRNNCEDNWWTNILYVNNLVKSDKICFGHSWYLANDMQFFVLSPLMMVPFVFNKVAGFLSCFLFLVTSWITTGVLSHDRKWSTTSASLRPNPDRADAGEWMQHYYIVPWCRIGPFIVGIMAGYILAKTKGRPFKMPGWLVVSGWVVSLATGLAVVYGLYGDIKGDNPSTLGAAAFYNAVNRSAWGACVSWVIIACSAGYGGPVNTLLSWSPFVVLGRLTYMSYLIHICIVYTFYQNLDTPFSFNDTTMVVYYLGVLVFVNLSAFVAVLVLESPMLGLEKTFIKRGKRD